MLWGLDPLWLLVMVASGALSLGAQLWVKSAVGRFSRVATGHGLRGADVAGLVLEGAGVRGVGIAEVGGFLSDHYDPSSRVLRLSPDNFRGASIAAAGIAAHEAGHAVQDRDGYWPMRVRQRLVPLANVGTNLGVLLVVLGMAVHALALAKLGVVLFGGFVAFTLITLPVEIDASRRAYAALARTGAFSRAELDGVRRVLTAAAATYVAAAATALLQLLYFVLRLGGGDREREA